MRRLLSADLVSGDLVIEGLEADPQLHRGPRLVVVRALEGFDDELMFHLTKAAWGLRPPRERSRGRPRIDEQGGRHVLRAQHRVGTQRDRSLDGVAELPDVPRPWVAEQGLLRVLREPDHAFLGLDVELVDEASCEWQDVL